MCGKRYLLIYSCLIHNKPTIHHYRGDDKKIMGCLTTLELTPDTYGENWKLFVDNLYVDSNNLKNHFNYKIPKQKGNWYLV